jgi:hypothetical protein
MHSVAHRDHQKSFLDAGPGRFGAGHSRLIALAIFLRLQPHYWRGMTVAKAILSFPRTVD